MVTKWRGSTVQKLLPAAPTRVDEQRRRMRLVITALQVDRDGEVIIPTGAKLDAFRANPIVLFSHNPMQPVANAPVVEVFQDRIEAEVEFFQADESSLADSLWKLYSRGKMRAASIGFLPIEVSERPVLAGQTGKTFLQWELLEFSLVAIPSLREALVITERELVLAHQKALGRSWRPSPVADVRSEFIATLGAIQQTLVEVRCNQAIRECDRALALVQLIDLEEELYGGWR